jgi:hypothetical protein
VPALTMCALQILLSLTAGDTRLDRPLPVACTDDWYQYDDGSAYWVTWTGVYRGVWFNVQDFGAPDATLSQMQYWFCHHSSYPWDTASFYSELYNGASAGPETQLNQTSVTAVHYAPCYADYGAGIYAGVDFWGLINTEMSAGGWPSVLGDNTPNGTGYDHSFYSDDFIVWNPWVPEGVGLEQDTWGAVKTLYGSRSLGTPGCCDYFIRFEMLWGGCSSMH